MLAVNGWMQGLVHVSTLGADSLTLLSFHAELLWRQKAASVLLMDGISAASLKLP